MVITHKIQCFPNKTQESIINQTLGACRWIWNNYLAYNIENHKDSYKEINGKPDFADGDLMHHLPPGAFPPFEEVIKRNEERAK